MLTQEIFKANDIRGLAGGPDAQWDADGAYALGVALVGTLELQPGSAIVLGRDMRSTGGELSTAFAEGVVDRGVDVIDIGLSSTDELWFASGRLQLPGVQFTASHNPATYNGIKFCLAEARPVTPQHLIEIARRAFELEVADERPEPVATPGTLRRQDLLPAYAEHLNSLVDLSGVRRLKVVIDAGNGMAGHTVPTVLQSCDLELIGLFMDLDGSFPNHQPNPLEPQNLVDARRAVLENGADLALVFDGDADRCFIIDERGEVVSPSAVTALIAAQELRREPGATIVGNTITSRTVKEVVAENGGTYVISRVGHTYVKAAMAEHDAIFGGEHSAHYYFREFWSADTGMLAGLHVLAMLGRVDVPLSELAKEFDRYAASGEINSTVADARATMQRVAEALDGRGGEVSFADGLLVEGDDWWVNLRPSNTEPLLRLNVEARDARLMESLRDEVLALVREETR